MTTDNHGCTQSPAVQHQVGIDLSAAMAGAIVGTDANGDECTMSPEEIANSAAAAAFACALANAQANQMAGVECPLLADNTCPTCDITIDGMDISGGNCGSSGETGRRRQLQDGQYRVTVAMSKDWTAQINAVHASVKDALTGLI